MQNSHITFTYIPKCQQAYMGISYLTYFTYYSVLQVYSCCHSGGIFFFSRINNISFCVYSVCVTLYLSIHRSMDF